MKLNRKFSPVVLLLFGTILLSLNSCEEGYSPDLRDELVGYYDYTVQVYDLIDGEMVYLGDQPGLYDVTGEMRVRKNYQYTDMIDFYDGEELMFQGENVRDAGNAIVFDIPLQEGWIGPLPLQVAGYDYWEVNSQMYHGAYFFNDESIEIGFSAYVMDVNSGLVMVLTAFRD